MSAVHVLANYHPPVCSAIPVVRSRALFLKRYGPEAEGVWIEMEDLVPEDRANRLWASYHECVPSSAGETHNGYLSIYVDTLWETHLHVKCLAHLAYPLGHDIQLSRLIPIAHPKDPCEWLAAYEDCRAVGLEWLSYARVFVARSALLIHEDDQLIMARVAFMEGLNMSESYSYTLITARNIARRCGWYRDDALPRGGDEDMERTLCHLEYLVQENYLLKEVEPYKAPTYRSAPYLSESNWAQRQRLFKRWDQVDPLTFQ